MGRKSYEESFRELEERGGLEGSPAPEARRRPRHDDDPPGPSFFRASIEEDDFQDLNLPGLWISRSEILGATFRNCDFHRSAWVWNDFRDCVFESCDLSECDLRANDFVDCRFEGCALGGADLRRSGFERCSFASSDLTGAAATLDQEDALGLDDAQAERIAWTADPGPEPEGG